MTEYILRRHMCITPHAFDIVRRAWQRDMRRVAIKSDRAGRFAR